MSAGNRDRPAVADPHGLTAADRRGLLHCKVRSRSFERVQHVDRIVVGREVRHYDQIHILDVASSGPSPVRAVKESRDVMLGERLVRL